MKRIIKKINLLLCVAILGGMSCVTSSCSKDDEPKTVNIVGTWQYTEEFIDADFSEMLTMTLKFNNDRTGSITENWVTETRASSNETYRMDFSWATSVDSSGNEILKISYISGDKNTELFPGSSSTALWTRQYVLTGNILNIYDGQNNGVWVFKRK